MEFSINGRRIGTAPNGDRHPVYVIAELSANHGNDFQRAADIVLAAAEAGADAVKLQTYTADTLTLDCDRPEFKIDQGTLWDGQTLYDLYQQAHMPWEWQPRLKKIADEIGIALFSSPFDRTAVQFLESFHVPAYKIASFEIVDVGLIKDVAQAVSGTGRPVIVSTGMSTPEEIQRAVQTLRENGVQEIALLKCTSAYPAPPESMNLATIADMAERYQVPIGLSDHTLGITAAVTSVAMGAAIIEKHVCLSRDDGGPDAAFSLEPNELAELIQAVRTAEGAIGTIHYARAPATRTIVAFAVRSSSSKTFKKANL